MAMLKVKLVTWEDVVNLSKQLSEKIKRDNYQPDVVIAIARGGVVVARLICDFLGILDLLTIKVEHWVETAAHLEDAVVKYPLNVDLNGKKVLLVDDISDTGKSFAVAKKHIEENCHPLEIRTASMQHISPVSTFRPDYYAEEVKEWTWFMYPWNYVEDTLNLTKKIMQKDKSRKWKYEELLEEFKDSYGIVPPVDLEYVLNEGVRRKAFKVDDLGYFL